MKGRSAMKHPPCGARTKTYGTPCRAQGLGRGGRCRVHGGCSTGPRTEAGRRRVSEAAKARWAAWRAARGRSRPGDAERLRKALVERHVERALELEDIDAEHLG
jgi:hypothetical protein